MKAIRLTAPQSFQTFEVDEPNEPAPGEALVRTVRMGICGTDASCYLGKFPFFDYPRIPGHELGVGSYSSRTGCTKCKTGRSLFNRALSQLSENVTPVRRDTQIVAKT
jgi:alcohol dehydrogenase